MLSDAVRLPGHALESTGPLTCAALDLALSVLGIAPAVVESSVSQSPNFTRSYVVAAVLALAGLCALVAARIRTTTPATAPTFTQPEHEPVAETRLATLGVAAVQPAPTHAFVKPSRDRSIVLAICELEGESAGPTLTSTGVPRRHHHH